MKPALLAILGLLAISLVGCGPQAASVEQTQALSATTTPTAAPAPSVTQVSTPSVAPSQSTATPTQEVPTPEPSGLPPPALVEFLRARQYGEIVFSGPGSSFDIEYWPLDDGSAFTVKVRSDRTLVERAVGDFFRGYGVENLSTLRISWCEGNPDNPHKGLPYWECSLILGK